MNGLSLSQDLLKGGVYDHVACLNNQFKVYISFHRFTLHCLLPPAAYQDIYLNNTYLKLTVLRVSHPYAVFNRTGCFETRI